jgi:hypothetical protein
MIRSCWGKKILLRDLFNQDYVEGEVVKVNNSCAKPNLFDAFLKYL